MSSYSIPDLLKLLRTERGERIRLDVGFRPTLVVKGESHEIDGPAVVEESVEDMLPKTIEELEDLQKVDNSLPGMGGALPMLEETIDPDKAESELLKERIVNLIQSDNIKAAYALNQWIEERRAS